MTNKKINKTVTFVSVTTIALGSLGLYSSSVLRNATPLKADEINTEVLEETLPTSEIAQSMVDGSLASETSESAVMSESEDSSEEVIESTEEVATSESASEGNTSQNENSSSLFNTDTIQYSVEGTTLVITGGVLEHLIDGVGAYFAGKIDMSSITEINITGEVTFIDAGANAFFRDFTNVTSISGLEKVDVSQCTMLRGVFVNMKSLLSIDLSSWDVSNVTNTNSLFSGCNSLTELDLSAWKVNNIRSSRSMFGSMTSLEKLDLSGWETENLIDMSGMFVGMSKITELNINHFDVSKVASVSQEYDPQTAGGGMATAFRGMSSLKALDLSNWKTPSLKRADGLFQNMDSLEYLDISGFDMTNITNQTGMFDLNQETLVLKKIVLGEDFSFKDSSVAGESGFSSLVPPTELKLWGRQNQQTMKFDSIPKTAEQLESEYNGQTLSGTWTWLDYYGIYLKEETMYINQEPLWDPKVHLERVTDEYGNISDWDTEDVQYSHDIDFSKTGKYEILYSTEHFESSTYLNLISKIININFVNEENQVIGEQEKFEGGVGEEYQFKAKSIDDYILASVEGEASGVLTEETQDVTFKYIKLDDALELKQEVFNTDNTSLDGKTANKEDTLNYKVTIRLNDLIDLDHYTLNNLIVSEVIDPSLEDITNLKMMNLEGDEVEIELDSDNKLITYNDVAGLSREWVITYNGKISRTAETGAEIKEVADITLELDSNLLDSASTIIGKSNEVVTIVEASPLSLVKAPLSINYGNSNKISSSTQKYEYQEVSDDNRIIINDGRGVDTGWSLYGKMEKELTNGSSILESALSYKGQTLDTVNGALIYNQEKTENSNDVVIEINKEDLLLTVLPGQARIGDYEGTIIWSLMDTPANEIN
ncbi:BspA family leucine-rich repeat surface protein [Vagococcus zengguangii]|uniref:BspA family leucine-rich repeat surface protein n=1 Tax=Vagococcus zengguangii TaxID=2571750 RepID=A0A4D7CT05_9ENTE|nr:BspA family leucine-rich repeat surface protein [Vagococcus zengguangii]QCI86293.1 BspA family leucine-rich repeat surface protein [Vagococcus zengguangii]